MPLGSRPRRRRQSRLPPAAPDSVGNGEGEWSNSGLETPLMAATEASHPPPPVRPTFVGPLEASLRHPIAVAIPLILLLGASTGVGLDRDPIYSAEARVTVGRIDVPAYTLQGVVIGNETLAAGYARAISAEPVIRPASRAAGVSPRTALDRLDASPIPGSTLIRVEAEGPSERESEALANAGANALIDYVRRLNAQQRSTNLLQQFRRARARTDRLRRRLQVLQRQDSPDDRRVRGARIDLETAQLASTSLADQYRTAQGGSSPNLLQLIAPANNADSDLFSVLQRLLLIAGGAGLVLGIGLALLRANRQLRRRRT